MAKTEEQIKNAQKNDKKESVSTTKKLVGTATFAALAYVISFFEFPIFSISPFLKLDFSAVFVLLSGFLFGPIFGITTCLVKEFICFATKSSTGGVGEIANFLVISGFILLPTLIYKYRKGIKTVLLTLVIACLIQVILSLLVNRFINFPLYMGDKASEVFGQLWWAVLLFNLIKSVSISAITLLFYKRISLLIKII